VGWEKSESTSFHAMADPTTAGTQQMLRSLGDKAQAAGSAAAAARVHELVSICLRRVTEELADEADDERPAGARTLLEPPARRAQKRRRAGEEAAEVGRSPLGKRRAPWGRDAGAGGGTRAVEGTIAGVGSLPVGTHSDS
jgi:hypothetical protein